MPNPCFRLPVYKQVSVAGITKWPQVLKEAYRCVKPGGYVELSETSSKYLYQSSITESI
jgi:ubiquinone/menaquinone biosynthesis C-methylase UbiE